MTIEGATGYQQMIKPCVIGSTTASLAVGIIAAVAISILFPPVSAVFISGVGIAGVVAISTAGAVTSAYVSYLSVSNFLSAKQIYDEVPREEKKRKKDYINDSKRTYSDTSSAVKAQLEIIENVNSSFRKYKKDELIDLYSRARRVAEAQLGYFDRNPPINGDGWQKLLELDRELNELTFRIQQKFGITMAF